MQLEEVIKHHKQKRLQELFTIRCNLIPLGDETVRLEFRPDAYALVNEKDIDPLLIFPLTKGEDPSGRESEYALKLTKETKVELHVKNLVHTFELGDSTRPFYIDEDKGEIVYLDTVIREACGDPSCKKRVTVADIYCCNGRFYKGGFGLVGCSDDWCEEDCCE